MCAVTGGWGVGDTGDYPRTETPRPSDRTMPSAGSRTQLTGWGQPDGSSAPAAQGRISGGWDLRSPEEKQLLDLTRQADEAIKSKNYQKALEISERMSRINGLTEDGKKAIGQQIRDLREHISLMRYDELLTAKKPQEARAALDKARKDGWLSEGKYQEALAFEEYNALLKKEDLEGAKAFLESAHKSGKIPDEAYKKEKDRLEKEPQLRILQSQISSMIDAGSFDQAKGLIDAKTKEGLIKKEQADEFVKLVDAAKVRKEANDLLLAGDKAAAEKKIRDNEALLKSDLKSAGKDEKAVQEEFDGLLRSVSAGNLLMLRLPTEWAKRSAIDFRPESLISSPSDDLKKLQKMLKETVNKDGIPYLSPTHPEDGKPDADTFMAIYSFANREGKEPTREETIASLEAAPVDESQKTINVDERLMADLDRVHGSQPENAYNYSVRSQVWNSKLGELLRMNFDGIKYENIVWSAIEYLKNTGAIDSGKYSYFRDQLFSPVQPGAVLKAADFEFILDKCNVDDIDLSRVSEASPQSDNGKRVLLSRFTMQAVDLADPSKAKMIDDPELSGVSSAVPRTAFDASSRARIALFRDGLRQSGIHLPSEGRGRIISDYFTSDDMSALCDELSRDVNPYVQYNLKMDQDLRSKLAAEAGKLGDGPLKSLLQSMSKCDSLEKSRRIYVSAEQYVLLKNYGETIADADLKAKIQIVLNSIGSDRRDGLTADETKALREFASASSGAKVSYSDLEKAAIENPGAAALLRMITVQAVGTQEMRTEWWAVAPIMASRPSIVAGSTEVTSWKTQFAKETGLESRLLDLNKQIEELKTNKTDAGKLLQLTAERDGIYRMLTNTSVSPEFYKWLVSKYSQDKGAISEWLEWAAAGVNKGLFGAFASDQDGSKKNFDDMLNIALTADAQIRAIGNPKLTEIWEKRGFVSLDPSGVEFEGLGLTAEQQNTINNIKQALSAFMMLTVDPRTKQLNMHPNSKMTLANLGSTFGITSLFSMGLGGSTNSVKNDLKSLCIERYGELAQSDPVLFEKYRQGLLASEERTELNYLDLQILKRIGETINLPADIITRLDALLMLVEKIPDSEEYKAGKPIEIEPGSEAYTLLMEYRRALSESKAVMAGDQYAQSVSKGTDRSGMRGYWGGLIDPDSWALVWNNLSEKDKQDPVMSAIQTIWEDLGKNGGEIPKELFWQQVNMNILIPYYIYLGLPAQALSMSVQSLKGETSWAETGKMIGSTGLGFFMFRYPPIWYRQAVQELRDENYAAAYGMILAANFFTMAGGYNSAWGRAFQPYTESLRLASKIPGFEKIATRLPGAGFERRAYERLGNIGCTFNFRGREYRLTAGKAGKAVLFTTMNQLGGAMDYLGSTPESAGAMRRGAQKGMEGAYYGLQWAVNKPASIISDMRNSAGERIQRGRIREAISAATGGSVNKNAVTQEQVLLGQDFSKKGGSLIFDTGEAETSIRLTNGDTKQLNPTGEGSLRGLMDLHRIILAAKNGQGALASLYDKKTNTLRLAARINGKEQQLSVAEVRTGKGISEPYYTLTKPSEIAGDSMYQAVLYLPENTTDAQIRGLSQKTPAELTPAKKPSSATLANTQLQVPVVSNGIKGQWQSLVPASRGVSLHDNQVQAMQMLKQDGNIYLNVGCGQGKTIIGVLTAMDYSRGTTKGIDGAHVITSNDGLVDDWVREAKALGLREGRDFGVVKQGMSPEQKRRAYRCKIVVGADQMIFDSISGEFSESEIGRKRKALITDESDQKLIDTAETAYYISGLPENIMNAVTARRAAKKYQATWNNSVATFKKLNASHFKDGKLNTEGIELISKNTPAGVNLNEEINRIEKLNLAQDIKRQRASKSGDRRLAEKYRYIVSNGQIVIVNSEGYPVQGQRWEGGIDEAIRLSEGLKVQAPQSTLASITFKQFMSKYAKNMGFSGTNADDWKIISRQYPDMRLGIVPNFLPEYELTSADLLSEQSARRKAREIARGAAGVEGNTVKIINRTEGSQHEQVFFDELRTLLGNDGKSVVDVKRLPPRIYETRQQKFKAIAVDTVQRALKGQPVLVSVTAIEDVAVIERLIAEQINGLQPSEKKRLMLQKLTAENVESKGAKIKDNAGKPGVITLATTAARGVDVKLSARGALELLLDSIKLKGNAREHGGLHVQVVEQDTTRRLTTQKEMRSARQGDPGTSRVWMSLEDQLFSVVPERVKAISSRVKQSVDISRQVAAVVDEALTVHSANTESAIERSHLFADTSDTLEKTYQKLYDDSAKGNNMVRTLVDQSVDELLRPFQGSETLSVTQRQKMQTALSKLLNRNVDLSVFDNQPMAVVRKAVGDKLFEAYIQRFGSESDFNRRVMTDRFMPGTDGWTMGVQNILRRNYSSYKAELKTIEAELQGALASENRGLRDMYEQRARAAYDRMMNNVRKELFSHLYRTRALSKVGMVLTKGRGLDLSFTSRDIAKAKAALPPGPDAPAQQTGADEQEARLAAGGQSGMLTIQQAQAMAKAGAAGIIMNPVTQLFDGLLNHPQMVSAEARAMLKGGIKVLSDREFNKAGIKGDAIFVGDTVYMRRSAVQTGRDGNLTRESGQRVTAAVLHELSEVHVRASLGEQGAEAAHQVGLAAEQLPGRVKIDPTRAQKVANAAKSMAASGAIFTVFGTAIDIGTRLAGGEEVALADVGESAFHNFAGVTEFNIKSNLAKPFLGAHAGGFVFKYDMLKGMTDERSAALGLGNFAGFEAGTKTGQAISRLILKKFGVDNPWLAESLGVGLGLTGAKLGELGTHYFGDRFNIVYENPLSRGTLALGLGIAEYDPASNLTEYFRETLPEYTVLGKDINPLTNGIASIPLAAAEYRGVKWAASKIAASKPVVQAAEKLGTTGGRLLATSAGAALLAGADGYDRAKKYEGRTEGAGAYMDSSKATATTFARGAGIGATVGTLGAVSATVTEVGGITAAAGLTTSAAGLGTLGTTFLSSAGTILSATGVGTVAAGALFVGGAAIMITKEWEKTAEENMASMAKEAFDNRIQGIKLAQAGWVSGINHGSFSMEKVQEMFPSLPQADQLRIFRLSKMGFTNALGSFIPKEGEDGGWRALGNDFSMINDTFRSGDWKGSYKDEQEFLDVNVPNWRFLVSQYSGQRSKFESRLYGLFASKTVQDYIILIEEKGFVPRNMVTEYLNHPDLLETVTPSDFWAKSGMTTELSQDEINELVKTLQQQPPATSGSAPDAAAAGGIRHGTAIITTTTEYE